MALLAMPRTTPRRRSLGWGSMTASTVSSFVAWQAHRRRFASSFETVNCPPLGVRAQSRSSRARPWACRITASSTPLSPWITRLAELPDSHIKIRPSRSTGQDAGTRSREVDGMRLGFAARSLTPSITSSSMFWRGAVEAKQQRAVVVELLDRPHGDSRLQDPRRSLHIDRLVESECHFSPRVVDLRLCDMGCSRLLDDCPAEKRRIVGRGGNDEDSRPIEGIFGGLTLRLVTVSPSPVVGSRLAWRSQMSPSRELRLCGARAPGAPGRRRDTDQCWDEL